MTKKHFIIEAALLAFSLLMLLALIFTGKGFFLYFLVWQAILGCIQFIHAVILTFIYKKDPSIWRALRLYWFLIALVLTGLAFHLEAWMPEQLGVFSIYVLPWFSAIYFGMLTYTYSKEKMSEAAQ